MKGSLFLLFMLQFSTGCILTDEKQTKTISGYSGGSVVLPCYCAQPQSTVHTFSWQFYTSDNRWIQVLEDQKYRGRVTLFSHISPTNLSLLISGLRKEDVGYYSCMSTANLVDLYLAVFETPHMPISYLPTPKHDVIVPARPISPRYIPRQIPIIDLPRTRQDARPVFPQYTQPCDLVNKESKTGVNGYSGESVVLPCSCTNLLSRPEHIQWMYWTENGYKEIYPKEAVESHKNRVKLSNQNTPGDLSLLISALTVQHQGTYYCTVMPQQHVYFMLNVKEKPQVYPTSSSTHGPSHQTPELPRQTHHTPLYVFILVAVFTSVLLLAFLALSTRYAKEAVANSAVVYVETAPIPTHRRNDQTELTEYVNTTATQT